MNAMSVAMIKVPAFATRKVGVPHARREWFLSLRHDIHGLLFFQIGVTIPCDNYYGEDNCKLHSDRCVYSQEANLCHNIGETLPCSSLSQNGCGSRSECVWLDTYNVCQKKGKSPSLPASRSIESDLLYPRSVVSIYRLIGH